MLKLGTMAFCHSFIFVFIQFILSVGLASVDQKLCVLGFNPKNSLEHIMLEKYFSGTDAKARVIYLKPFQATPADLRLCFSMGSTEVIIAAKTLKVDTNSSQKIEGDGIVSQNIRQVAETGGLTYYSPFSEAKHQELLKNTLISIEKRILKTENSSFWEIDFDLDMLKAAREKIINNPEEIPRDTIPRPIWPLVFQLIQSDLEAMRKEGKESNMKSLRLLTCDSDFIFEAYPELKQIVDEQNLSVSYSPAQPIRSLLAFERRSSAYDPNFYREASQNDKDHVLVYMPITTVIAGQFGEKEILSGQFRVSAYGMGFMAAHEWRLLKLPKEIFLDFKLGDPSKSLFLPMFGLNISPAIVPITLALGTDGSGALNPLIEVSSSFGISFNFTPFYVEVERIR